MTVKLADIHCHILPGFDDGPTGMPEALDMARVYATLGYSHIIATPHLQNIFVENEDISQRTVSLQNAIFEADIDLIVLSGAEIMLCPDLLNLIKEKKLPTLNGTRYVLIDLPIFEPFPEYAEVTFFSLLTQGYIPILAHPERNRCFWKEPGLLGKLVGLGVLLQIDSSSLAGSGGRGAFDTARYLLNRRLVSFLSNNLHNAAGRGGVAHSWMSSAWKGVKRYSGKQKRDEIYYVNPEHLIKDIPISEVMEHNRRPGLMGKLLNILNLPELTHNFKYLG